MENERLDILVFNAKAKQREIETLEAQLKQENAKLREMMEVQIPALMGELGLESAVLSDGSTVKVGQDIKSSITQEHQEAAFEWLNANGHGGVIKTVTKTSVHPQTLGALMRELLEAGEDVPLETFSIFRYTKVKIGS